MSPAKAKSPLVERTSCTSASAAMAPGRRPSNEVNSRYPVCRVRSTSTTGTDEMVTSPSLLDVSRAVVRQAALLLPDLFRGQRPVEPVGHELALRGRERRE